MNNSIGKPAIYTDDAGKQHAALITAIDNGTASLTIFPEGGGHDHKAHVPNVADAKNGEHSWDLVYEEA